MVQTRKPERLECERCDGYGELICPECDGHGEYCGQCGNSPVLCECERVPVDSGD